MDWSQFADPQILLGMGVFAFGVINAYMLRRQNHRLAADAVAHTGEQGPEIAEQSEVRQRTSATESSNIIGQINRKEEGEGLEATDETPTRSAGTEGDRVSASEPQLSPSPPTVLPSMRVRFENQVFEMEGNDHISRRRETGVRFRDEVDAKIMGASRDDPVMIERELNEGDVQKGKEEDELSDSSDTFTIEPNLTDIRMEDWSSDFEHYLNDNEIHHSLDLSSYVDSFPLMEAAIDWHLAAIPDLPPLLTLIPSNMLETTAISDVTEPYQSNLASQNDFTPLHLFPILSEEVEGEIHFSPFANPTATLLQGEECEREEKIRNFSSSDSSKTSDACFMSADEGDSFAEELFYDPLKVESMEAHDEKPEVILGITNKGEVTPELRHNLNEVETCAKEETILFDDTKEFQNAFSLNENRQAGATEISNEFDRSSEPALLTEFFNVVGIDQKSVLQFGEKREGIELNEANLVEKGTEDASVADEDMIKGTIKEADDSSHQPKDHGDDDKRKIALKFEVNHFLEGTQESSEDMGFEEKPSLWLNAGREPIISINHVDGTEIVIYFQGTSLEDKSMVLDEKKQAGISEISSGFNEDDIFAHSVDVFKAGLFECNQVDDNTNPVVNDEDLVSSVKDPFSVDSQKASIHNVASGFDEQLIEERSKEAVETSEQQGSFKLFSEGIAVEMNFETEQINESTHETFEEMHIELSTAMNLNVEKEPLNDRFQASKFEVVPHFHEMLTIHVGKPLIEEQRQAGSSEMSCTFHKADSLSSAADSFHQIIVAGSQKNEGNHTGTLRTVQVSSFKVFALQEALTKDFPENTLTIDDVTAEITMDEIVEASIKKEKIKKEEFQNLKYEMEQTHKTAVDYSEEINSSEKPSQNLITQVEPLKDRVQVGESESVQSFNDSLSPKDSELLLDTKKQAGSSEISSSFVKNEEPITSKGVSSKALLGKNRTHGEGGSVLLNADVVLISEDPSIKEQQGVGLAEIASVFDEVVVEEKSAESLLHPLENQSLLQESKCDKPPLKFGTEQTKKDETEMSEELRMKEEFGQTIVSHTKPIMNKLLPGGLESVSQFHEIPAENAAISLDEKRQVGSFEMSSAFTCNDEIFHSTETFDGAVTEGNRAAAFSLKILDFKGIIPSQKENTVQEIQNGVWVNPTRQETVLSTELEELEENNFADLVPPKDNRKADLSQIIVNTDGFHVKKSDFADGENVNCSNQVIISDVLIVHEKSVVGAEKRSTEFEDENVSIDLQSPIENIEHFCKEEIATVILRPGPHSAEYHLPQNLEFHTLEQPFNLLEKYSDFEEHVIKGMQQSFDGRMTTLSTEIVVSDDDQSQAEQCTIHEPSTKDPFEGMNGVRRHSIQLRRQSSHFSLNIDAFDTSKSLFETWSEKGKPERGRYYVSFTVEAFRRRDTSPDLVSVEEDETIERLDGDNPDRWVVEAAAPDRCGRLASVCVLDKPVASRYRLSTGKNPREQFRDEVLTITNKQQECLMKRRHAITDLAEEEEGYQLRIKTLRNILERLDGTQFKDDKKVPLPKEMIAATKGMLSHLDRIVSLSESTRGKLQACVMDPPNASTCFLQNESEWAQYSGYLYHLNCWMESFKTILTDPKLNNLFGLTPENDEEESRIDAQHLLEYLFAPRTHLLAYEHLLSCLARYTSRNEQDTRGLEEAITAVRSLQRRTTEALRLWPSVANMPADGSLGILPSANAYNDANQLPRPITRMTLVEVTQRKGEGRVPTNNQEGFLVLNQDKLLFIKGSPSADKKYEIAWMLPLQSIRLRPEGEGIDTKDFEIWDISNPKDPVKVIYTICTPDIISRQAWLQDIQRTLKNYDIVDYLVDVALLRAHEEAAAEANQTRTNLVDDTITEVTDGITDSFYDADEMLKSKTYDSDAALPQSRVDDESSLTYYTAEGSVMQLAKQGTTKQRPDSILSIDSVNTLDGVSNPFMEQIPELENKAPEINQVVITQSIKAKKPYVHRSELQNINSSEGGEMELNIETSTSDNDAYTAEWTFNGVSIDAENMSAYPRIEGNTAYLLVPKVSKKLHEGCYECTLTWPSGMQAIFPFTVVVHKSEDGVDPTNKVSKLRLKTAEISKLTVPNEDEESCPAFHEVEMDLLHENQRNKDETEETLNSVISEASEHKKLYRVAKMSIIGIDHEPSLRNASLTESSDATRMEESIVSSVVPTTLDEAPTAIKPFIQEYMKPTKVNGTEGEPFKIITPEAVGKTSSVWWTMNGRKLPSNVFETERRSSSVGLIKSTFSSSDSGEYTLWVDGKVKANFVLRVEKAREEEAQKEVGILEKGEEALNEKTELPMDKKKTEIKDQKPKPSPMAEEADKGEYFVEETITKPGGVVQLTEGDKFHLNTEIPLNAHQIKSDRLWWTKNGKPLVDVDGVASRSAKFTSKSSTKSPASVVVELIKKDPVSAEDTATYALMGEPRIKRGFKPQETTYATIVVSVGEKPKADVDEVENEPAAASAGVEGKKNEPTKEVPEAEKLPEEQEVDEDKRKKKMSKGESGEEKPKKKRKSIESEVKLGGEEAVQQIPGEILGTLTDTAVGSMQKSKDEENRDETEPKRKKSKDLRIDQKPKRKEKVADEGSKEKVKKKSFESEAELEPVEALAQAPEAAKPIPEENLTETVDGSKKISQKEEVNEIKTKRKKSKDESGGEKIQKRKNSIEGEVEEPQNNEKPMDMRNDLPTSPTEDVRKEESISAVSMAENIVKLIEGDKFQLTTKVPLDSLQMKSDRLWWTKNGKDFLDVDGVAQRVAKFTSRSTPKSPRSAEVELVKKNPTELEDAATYKLMGEPRIKHGFKPQETTYATIVVSVVEKPEDDSSKSPVVEDEEMKFKDTEAPNVPQQIQSETDRQNQHQEAQKKDFSQEKVKKYEVHPKKEKSEDESPEEKCETKGSSEGVGEKSAKDLRKDAPEEEASPVESKEVGKDESTPSGTVVKLTEGDKFHLNTEIPLNAHQIKSDRLWWTKNGKPLVDVDGVASRSAKFTSKSSTKSPASVVVELIKKDPVSAEDTATYALMGEPRIKRGFKPQETTYATIVVSVGEKPKADVDEVENEPAAASAGVEGKKNEPTKEVPEAEKLPEEQEVDEDKRKKKMSKGESGEEKPKKKRKSIESEVKLGGEEAVQQIPGEILGTLTDTAVGSMQKSKDEENRDETEPKRKKSKDLRIDQKPKRKEKVADEGSKEKVKKKSFESEAELEPVEALAQAPEAAKPIPEENLTETVDGSKKISQKEEVNEIKTKRKKSKDESGGEKIQKRKNSIEGEVEEPQNNEKPMDMRNDLPTSPTEDVRKEESISAVSMAENIVKLIEGDKFQLTTKVPLDSLQMKSDRLWWTKNGKDFLDVDGVAQRVAKFTSRSTPKSPRSAEVELVKKNPTELEDAATYKLMGEPRIKHGFKPQETTYATIVVSVVEKPEDDSSKSPVVEDEEMKFKDTEAPNVPQQIQSETDRQNQHQEAQKKDFSQEKVKKYEVHPKKEKSEDESPEEKCETKGSSEGVGEKSAKDLRKDAPEEEASPVESKEVGKDESTPSGTVVKLTEGDKFHLNTEIPLNAHQIKSDRLWWTKNGKPLVDVDGVASRSAKFTSKSSTKSPASVVVELIKKDPVSAEDTATYALMGEPRIKRGFKPQETTYATIVVSVGEKPKADVDEVENEPAAASAGVEGKKNEPTKEVPEAEKLPEEQEVDEDKRKKKMSKGESGEEKPKKKRKSIDGEAEPRSSETLQEESVKPIQEVRKGSLASEPAILTRNVVSLITGDKLQLSTSVSLDARQFKTEKFWWTKDGKPFLDVDGITPRKAIYTSKSKPKPPRSTDIELTKKEPATIEDTATYVLMGEPRVKRGFKSQETTYATIIVKVSDNPPAISGEITKASVEISVSNELREEEQIKPEPVAVMEETARIEDEEKPKDNQAYDLVGKAAEADIKERKEKRKKKSKSREGEGEEVKRKSKRKKASDEDVEKLEEAAPVVEKIETKSIETVELRCIEANANKRLGHEKMPIPSGEPLCLTVTGIPPEVPSVLWTLNGQPVRSGKRVQRLLEPNPLGKRYDGELMAQLYLDSTVLLDSGDYEITIEPTDLCPIKAHLSIPVEIVPAKKALAERRGRMKNQGVVEGEGENVNVLQVQPNLCQPLGFAACEGQSISLVADLSVPVDKVPPESVSWSRNGVLLSPDDPSHDFSIQASEKNQDHTSVILHKPAVTLDDVGFYSVTYNPLPTIKEEPLAEAADEEGYGTGWEVDFPELLIFPAETVPCPDLSKTPVFTKELPKEIRVSEGDTITLDAEIAKPLPGLTPIWSVNGRDINPSRTSEYVVWDSGNYFALTIPAASKHHLGEYELRLSAGQGREPMLTSCHVRGKSDFGAMPHATPNRTPEFDIVLDSTRAAYVSNGIAPMFTKKLANLDCSSGETMELTCRVVGDPIPHFFWRHNGELVESDYHHRVRSYDNTSTLKIFSVEPRDRGTYICSAVNELGKTQTSAKISVDGTNEPIEETEVETSRIRPPRYGLPRTAPEGLMLESATSTELMIRWSPVSQEGPSDMVYTVEMSKDNGYFWSPVLTGLQTTRATLPHTIATPLQPIQLRVHAENSLGTGPPSQPVLKIPPRACVPNMTAVKPVISNVDLTSVMIMWSGPSGGAPSNVSYIVEVREGTRGDWKPVASGLKDKTYTYHLKPGVSTLVRVRAYNEFGTSEPSATAIANLPVEHLIPDFAIDPPWVSVIRPDVSCSKKSAYPGLMLHWKEAYLPEYCDNCVSGLKPIYTLEWKKGRTGPWRMVDDYIVDTTVYKLPGYIVRAVQEASTPTSQSPEIRVVCRNDYGSTLPTKSLRLTNFGLPKQTDSETEKLTRSDEALFSLPIVAPLDGEERSPLWLTSTDIENGVSLKWDETFRCRDGNLHGKYRMEYALMPSGYTTEPEGLWEPVGPRSQPILGDSYCLDLPLHSSAEQRIRLLALTNSGSVFGWLNAYRQVRLPSKRQLLPSPVEGLRACVFQPKEKGEVFSVRLDWNHSGQTEGERILEEQLEPGVFFTPQVISYRVEVQENHGFWREIGTVIGSLKTFFEHKTPMSGVTLRYRVIPINRFGEGPKVETPAVHIPKRLSELQGCVEDLKVLIVAPCSIFLRWRLGDEAIDALESMGRRVVSSPTAARGMGDSGYEENADLHGLVRYCVERRDAFSSSWYSVVTVESLQDELTGKVTLRDCPKEMYGNEYRVIAFLNNQPCAPSRPVRINVKTAELAPDLSYHKAKVDVSKVDEYQIAYPEEVLEGFFSSHVLAFTLPQSLEENLTFDIEAVCGNRKEWEKIATGLSSPVFSWDKVNPLLPYSFRVVGRNQFGVGLPSRATHVDAQVVIPDLSFVVPTVREAMGILEGREPPEMRWQTPKVYNLTQTLTPFTYEVQMRRVASGSASDEWEVFRGGLKQPRCSLEGLDPTQEYVLRVVAVTNFGRGEPSQPTRKRKSRARNSSQSMGNYSSLNSSFDSIPPQFENPSPEVVYVPCGGDLDLRCTLISINLRNLVQFIWFFNYQEIPDVPKHEQFPSGYFQHVTGGGKSAQLRLFDLDERDFGTYTCKAVNNFGATVKEFLVVRADAPVITEVPLPIITLSVHHTLLLPCCVDAVPAARITWTRDSKRLTSSHRTWIGGETSSVAQLDLSANEREAELGELTVDASLRVERCVFQDAGLYTMIAENPAGRAQTSCIVRIEEKLSPRTITPRWSNVEKHYFVLHQIATGSFSRAHLLIDKKTSREYVGKVYALADPMTRVLGAREFECLNRLHHNNVVEMVDAVVSDDYLVLVTERLSGNHLLEEIILGHTWTEAAATMLIKELLEAVAHVHEEGIVHLDIQPDNIIFPRGTSSRTAGLEGLMQALNSLSVDTAGAGGRSDVGVVSCFVKLTGFSMAQPMGQRTALQMSSIMPPALWCPDFAAPELLSITTALSTEVDSKVSVGFAADVWSIGVIAYLLLFGEHPVIHNADETLKVDDCASVGDEIAELMTASTEEFEKDVSPEAIDFLCHLLATEPCNRPTAKECLQHPWLAEGRRSARNLENSLNSLKVYQRIYQKRKTIPTGSLCRESFLRFAGRACIEAVPGRRSTTPPPSSVSPMLTKTQEDSVQLPRASSSDGRSSERGCSIDRDLTSRITTLMIPPEERFGFTGSGTSSLRSSLLHLDIDEYQINKSPLESPSPRLDPWSSSPSLLSADDSSEPIKRLCDNISKKRDEQILPVEPHLCEGPLKSTTKLAPIFSNPLRDSRIDPQTNSVFFSCQLASPPRLPAPELLYQRNDVRENLEALGMESFALCGGAISSGSGGAGNYNSGSVAAAWYLAGCLLSEAPGVSLGASSDGWLWLRLDDAQHGMVGKVVECVVRARNGKAKTRARILLPEPPSPPGRPGILQSASTEVLVGWTCGNDDSCEDFIYRVDVKYPDAKPVASAWRTVGYSVDRRFLISGLQPEQAYRVRVCVRNAVGWSAYSIASSEFRLHSGHARTLPLMDEEREWILRWRQASHPFGLSDHPEAMSTTASSKSVGAEHEAFRRPPPSGVVKEMIQAGGLFPHMEAVKMLCRTEGLISRGTFGNSAQLMTLIRCHPALVERGDLPNQRPEKQPLRLPAFLLARITRLTDASFAESLESQARQQALLLTLLRSTATTPASGGLEGAPLFTQQFGIRSPCLLPQGLSLGWLANDAARPTVGLGLASWIPGGALLDVLLARGEFTEFSVARWVYQLLCALRWLHIAFQGCVHGRVDFDKVQAARRTSALPDIVLTGVEPTEPWERRADCFTAPELDDGGKCSALSDLWSVGAFAYILLLAESISTSLADRQASRTPTPAGEKAMDGVETSRRLQKRVSTVSLPGGYRHLDRPVVNLKAIKHLSKWGRRFVYNALQSEPMSRGSLDFWLENDWFSLRPEVVKQLAMNTIPSKYLRAFRPSENLYGVVSLFPDEADPLSSV